MQYSGLSRQTLHNYTVAGLIVEAKRTDSGHRLYDETVFDYLDKIKKLQGQSYTLFEIKKKFEVERQQEEQRQKSQLSMDLGI